MQRRHLIIALLLLGLLRYAWLARCMHPYADDWSYAATAFDEPLGERSVHEYLSWNGRIASNILVLRGPLLLGLEPGLLIYRLLPSLWIILVAVGWLVLLRTLRPYGVPRQWALPGALLFTTLWLNTLPDLTEGLYWYTGVVTYTLPTALLLFFVASGIRTARWANGAPWWHWLLLSALGLWISWSSEVHLVIVVALVVSWIVARWRSGARVRSGVWVLMILLLSAAVIMVAAPGNATRGANFPLRADVFNTVSMGVLQTVRFLIAWILSPAICISGSLWLLHLRRMEDLPFPVLRLRSLLTALLATVFVIMALPYWATGILGQHRTVNVAFFLFLPLGAMCLVALEREVLRPRNIGLPVHRAVMPVLVVFLVLALVLGGNDGRVASDLLTGAAARSDSAWSARYAEVEQAAEMNVASLSFEPIPVPPVAIRIMELDTVPEHWTNTSLARYLGASGVRIMGPRVQ